MAKETAVQWLIDIIDNMLSVYIPGLNIPKKVYDKALQMEDEQRLEAWRGGIASTEVGGKSYDQYYNETFKK